MILDLEADGEPEIVVISPTGGSAGASFWEIHRWNGNGYSVAHHLTALIYSIEYRDEGSGQPITMIIRHSVGSRHFTIPWVDVGVLFQGKWKSTTERHPDIFRELSTRYEQIREERQSILRANPGLRADLFDELDRRTGMAEEILRAADRSP